MCGITALINTKGNNQDLSRITRMNQLIRHRGPDDEGYVFFKSSSATHYGGEDTPESVYQSNYPYSPKQSLNPTQSNGFIALGHRRLSILDLSPAGHQPMCSGDKRYWITYNGEIYNYIELRNDLKAKGYHFVSQTDTEVILHAYDHWGKDCLHHFNGMFAFVLYDQKTKSVFIARDRFGIKPLYYWFSPDGVLAIASEIKQFTILPGWKAKMEGQAVYDFLVYSVMDHRRETFFRGVKELRGGEYIECSFQSIREDIVPQKWYELSHQPFAGSFEEASERFRELFTDSVSLRLRADVPVGSCLSGGLDSSSIVCVANRILRERNADTLQKTFSAATTNKRLDESEFINEVISFTGTEGHFVYPSSDRLIHEIDSLVWTQDQPFSTTSVFAQWNVFKLGAENQVKVMLDGQGADELLAGYPFPYSSSHLASLLKRFRFTRFYRELNGTVRIHKISPMALFLFSLYKSMPNLFNSPLQWLTNRKNHVSRWFNVKKLKNLYPDIKHCLDHDYVSIKGLSFEQISWANLSMLLRFEDRNSMAHSIESRLPFLDYRLVEFAYGLRDEHKLSMGVTKRVLREGMKEILPEKINLRMDKIGFETPEEHWLRHEDPEFFRDEVKQAIEISQGIIRPSSIDLLERMIDGKEAFSFLPWRWISLSQWINKFNVKI